MAGSIVLGATVLRRAGQELGGMAAGGPETPRARVLRRRLTVWGTINIVLLVSTVWATVAKP